ncbi:DsbA family protein [Nocardioides okcheonensis]|uniref:DsbA family protein n=1 Tax=Nocardioides okcheonensis TaxID=2894081 RepID=UPI001E3567B7|nr:thioredoxin domain-containing protein [Nocardioides okcheonensis]UFN45977.1 DsbA family protein [Nocardioides okcheonensis]
MSKNTPERREARKQRAAEALRQKQAEERRRRLVTIGAVVAAVVVIVGGLTWWQSTRDTTGEAADVVPSVAAGAEADGTPGEIDGYGIVIGQADAPTTVTIYEDLQCPACANLEAQLGEPLAAAVDAGDVRLDYRMISFLDRASTNEYSSRALNAALAVLDTAGVDAFRAFHDDLYANQPEEGGPGFEDDELIDRAVAAGATESEIRPQVEDKVYEQWIENATDEMSQAGYNSTPTILIDGEDADAQQLAELLQ